MAVKYKLTGTDEHNIISSIEFDGDFTTVEDWEEFFVKFFVFLKRTGVDIPDEIQELIDEAGW
tara:strand:+ start:9611 stop:9799 length:189 start_codon:yes stop_codon:yes gene_type:complete